MNHNNETTQPTSADLVIERIFPASKSAVWQAWSQPELMKQWWGPKIFTAPVIKIDFRTGGKYLACMRMNTGQEFWSTGTYKEIIPEQKIVCTDSFSDAEGNIVPASYYGMEESYPLELQVTMTFEDAGAATRFTLLHQGMPAETIELCRTGWTESFDKLEALLAADSVSV